MEIIQDGLRAFKCDIRDFERILTIHKSRSKIHGVTKTARYCDFFETYVADILLGTMPDKEILAVEDLRTGELINYSIYLYKGDAAFIQFGEYIQREGLFGLESGIYHVIRLGLHNAAINGRFNTYWACQINAFLPAIKLSRQTNLHSDWYLHKIVYPSDPLDTIIEKTLLKDLNLEIKNPVVIIHQTLKMSDRINYIKDEHLSRKVLDKLFNQACSTSTKTSLDTNS